ncbi:MAG: AMP phosphorylase [Candidatus Diapherotrites archaeon CG08_land_8_20_14_0_20_34_12]|nr:MAG: AMP phosphorylase [Candidatus Diapherotrites archaeon CG08_land_8_20_14_0_20_34_12]
MVNEHYTKQLKTKQVALDAGKYIAILNEVDGKELGVHPLERIELYNPKTKRSIVTVVDITKNMVQPGEIGVFESIVQAIGIDDSNILDVKVVPAPRSLEYIRKKMENKHLTKEELFEIVQDLDMNRISEIEASAFVSAIFINGYSLDETIFMTQALVENGNRLKINAMPVVDKHSIGGLNGRATMIIVPIVAAAGLYCPKTSSRSITSAAGTADSMEVLANVSLPFEKIKEITEKIGAVIVWGGSLDLAPVDDKIIKIEHPLSLDPPGQIVASVLAKKESVGAHYVVIDIPVGPAMKVKDIVSAEKLANMFIEVGKRIGLKVESVLTDGAQPSGRAFGPALEAKYAMEVLEGKVYDELAQKSCELAGVIFELVGRAKLGAGTDMAKEILRSGAALKKMKEIINAQGPKAISSEEVKLCDKFIEIKSVKEGEISSFDIKELIKIARTAGAPADQQAGVLLNIWLGEKVKPDTVLYTIYGNNDQKLELARKYAAQHTVVNLETMILGKYA